MTVKVTHSTLADGTFSSEGAIAWDADHTLTGVGTMAEQNANNVAITGGAISGVTLPASNITGTLDVAHGGTGAATLTGYIKGSGTAALTASSTIPNTDITGLGTASTKDAGAALGVATLDAAGKVPITQIPDSVIGALSYQGTWNATTNTPTLTSSIGVKGYYYVVATAGTTNLNGVTDWQIGDWAVFDGLIWEKIDNTDSVTSVNTLTGAVVLTTTNIAEGTNEYFTQARARVSLSAGTAISYDNSTGVITNSAPDQVVALTGAGTTAVTGTYPNFTITSNDEFDGDVVGPASATDNAIARFDTTTGKLIQNSVVTIDDTGNIAGALTVTDLNYLDFNTAYATTLGAGQLGWDGNNTLGIGMAGGHVVQRIGEDTYIYVKASGTITKGQLCMFTGVVGASSVVTAAPSTGVTSGQYIIGLAAEDIATNGFGLIQVTGSLKGFDTSAFVDGDILYYDSAVTGGMTATYPTTGLIVTVAAVTNAAGGGAGSVQIRVSVTQRITASTGISVSQNGTGTTVTNTAPDQVVSIAGGTGISTSGTYPSFTVTNTAPDQTVAISSGTGISVTGTYPNFTVTNTSPSSGGTVTSVTATSPVTSTGGTTPIIAMPAATTSVNGYLTSTDWTTFNNKQPAGSYLTAVTADAPLSGSGTSGSHLVISQANTSTNGYLSSTDWNTFNNKGSGTVTSVSGTSGRVTSTGGATPVIDLATSGVSANTYGSSTAIPVITFDTYGRATTVTTAAVAGGQYYGTAATKAIAYNSNSIAEDITILANTNGLSAGPITISTGYTVTVATGAVWVIV